MENINKITNTELIDTKEREELRGQIVMSYLAKMKNPFVTLSVLDVSKDLHIGINHFKHNLEILYKSEKLKDGTKQ